MSAPAPSPVTAAPDLAALNRQFADAPPEALLRWAFDRFGDQVLIASSFGAEDVALIDLALSVNPKARIFTLDTGRLHEETYEVMEAIRRRYRVEFEVVFPERTAVEALERSHGFHSFRESIEARKACCGVRKVEPLKRTLADAQAWITGLRREQAVTRTALAKLEADPLGPGLIKLNPLADWSQNQVWAHIRERKIPYNRLHDQGFPSIGCAPCTRAVAPGEDVRAGRWWWETPEQKECGLHAAKPAAAAGLASGAS